MKTIAICNHKGGVGKTALSMAIAEGLHRKGKRTLLVDLDQQMNATQQAKIDTTDEVTVYDLLTSFDYTAKDGIKHFDGGDIIPGCPCFECRKRYGETGYAPYDACRCNGGYR